jgi:hypothetical protein
MRTLPILLSLVIAAGAGKPLAIHFAGWHSLHPDLIKTAKERTREELERSDKIALLPDDSAQAMKERLELPSEASTPEQALSVARTVHRRYVVWARLSRLDYEISRPFWRPFWGDRLWHAEADFFLFDSTKKTVKRLKADADTRVFLGFTGFTGASLLPAPELERARQSDELLRILSRKLREAVEDL